MKLLAREFTVLWRSGLPLVYLGIVCIYGVIEHLLPQSISKYVVPLFIYFDPATLGMFFIPAQILLLKDQGVFSSLLFFPDSPTRIIQAKIWAYTLLSVIASALIGLITGWWLETLIILPWLVFVCFIFSHFGVAAGLLLRSVNQLVLFLPLVLIPFVAPLFSLVPALSGAGWNWYPPFGVFAPMILPWLGTVDYFLLIQLIWTVLLYLGARWLFQKSWRIFEQKLGGGLDA